MYTSVEHDFCTTCYERPPVLRDRFCWGRRGGRPRQVLLYRILQTRHARMYAHPDSHTRANTPTAVAIQGVAVRWVGVHPTITELRPLLPGLLIHSNKHWRGQLSIRGSFRCFSQRTYPSNNEKRNLHRTGHIFIKHREWEFMWDRVNLHKTQRSVTYVGQVTTP